MALNLDFLKQTIMKLSVEVKNKICTLFIHWKERSSSLQAVELFKHSIFVSSALKLNYRVNLFKSQATACLV